MKIAFHFNASDWLVPEITCPELEAPDDGTILSCGGKLGEHCEFACAEGYIMERGSSRRTCQETGQWSGREPVCSGVCACVCECVRACVCVCECVTAQVARSMYLHSWFGHAVSKRQGFATPRAKGDSHIGFKILTPTSRKRPRVTNIKPANGRTLGENVAKTSCSLQRARRTHTSRTPGAACRVPDTHTQRALRAR